MRSIHRRCACGCGGITNPGNRYIHGHNIPVHTEETKRKISSSLEGRIPWNKGKTLSKETRLKMSIAKLKDHPDDEYCEVWRDRGYKRDLRKDDCENEDCRGTYKQLGNHHINLNKKDCRPSNVMTLCRPCHTTLHNQLRQVKNEHDILTINRLDKITYIHKRTSQIIATIIRIQDE